MATDVESFRPAALARRRTWVAWPGWPAPAWGSIVLVALFVATTCWWLSQNRGIPVNDAGLHLGFAINMYEALSGGHLLRALTGPVPYPPLTYLIGVVGIFVGGVGVAPPIIAENVAFVSLLALGCYKVGRLAFGPLAGLLAVVFALGSPLLIEGLHEFMLDVPEAALVAVAVWAILETERFSRTGVSALAGAAVGLGMLSKETFAFFVAGVVLMTMVRGGRHAWRGFAVFAAVALVIALPWYLYELATIHGLGLKALGTLTTSTIQAWGLAPSRWSKANLEWYFWSILNRQLYLPLFVFTVVGGIWMLAGFVRRRAVSGFAVELVCGALVSWAALTETYWHDPRYSIPMLVYLAVIGVGWVSRLPRLVGAAMATILVLVALANSLGVGFGLGSPVVVGSRSTVIEQPGTVRLYATHGYWVGAPIRTGDMLGLLRALRRNGVRQVRWYSAQEGDLEYSLTGIADLARIAGLGVASNSVDPSRVSRDYAFLIHGSPSPDLPLPCTELLDGAGVWVSLGGARGLDAWSYCPR